MKRATRINKARAEESKAEETVPTNQEIEKEVRNFAKVNSASLNLEILESAAELTEEELISIVNAELMKRRRFVGGIVRQTYFEIAGGRKC